MIAVIARPVRLAPDCLLIHANGIANTEAIAHDIVRPAIGTLTLLSVHHARRTSASEGTRVEVREKIRLQKVKRLNNRVILTAVVWSQFRMKPTSLDLSVRRVGQLWI